MKTHIYVFCVLLLWMQFPVSGYSGSSADDGRREELVAKADSLRKEYRFQEALQLYRSVAGSILGHQEDSTALSPEDSLLLEKIQSRRIMAENGLSMKQYVSEPVVVARHVFSAEDFYLFYPMPDRSWRPVPNPLDSIPGHRFVNATYVPEGSTDIYFSAEDGTGVRNLYHTHLEDSLWTVPVLLDEGLTSSGDEIFPVVSPDGKTIYFSSAGLSVYELCSKARKLYREHQIDCIIIDYLQLMNASGARFGSRQEEVSTISRSLKGLAKELDVPVLALSQLNRTVEGREGLEGKRPQLSDLRESGAIEQDADMVLFVHRPEYYRIFEDEKGNDLHGKAQIIIAKHRKGGTGDVLLNFRGEFTRFENPNDTAASSPLSGEIIGSRINGADDMPVPPYDGFPGNEPLPF